MGYKTKPYNNGKSWHSLGVHTCADDTDTGVQDKYRMFIPDTTGALTVRYASGGSTEVITVVAGGVYQIGNIYSFDATGSDSTTVGLYA